MRCLFLSRLVCWHGWYEKHIPTNLCQANAVAEQAGLTIIRAREAITKVAVGPLLPSMEHKLRKGLQRWLVTEMLSQSDFNVEERLRQRLERWSLPGIRWRVARRTSINLKRMHNLVTPRVAAAVISTFFNRWTTDRRMRGIRDGSHRCRLGCTGTGKDSIEHYLRCPVLHAWMWRRLRSEAPSGNNLFACFFALPLTALRLRQLAVSMYVAYRAVNHLRSLPNSPSESNVSHYTDQALHEGTRGHFKLQRALQFASDSAGGPVGANAPRRASPDAAGRRVRRRRE